MARLADADGGAIDQLANVVADIRRNPNSRRLVVTAWNPAEIEGMALPPCHWPVSIQCRRRCVVMPALSGSADVFLGVPFNIASYALLTAAVAQVTGLRPERSSIAWATRTFISIISTRRGCS